MRAKAQQEKVREVLIICKDHWRSNGIPENEVEFMGEEVEEDLSYAARNGKTVEEVVGPDTEKFAGLYTDEPSLDTPKVRMIINVILVAIFLFVTAGIAARLFGMVSAVPFSGSLEWLWYVILSALVSAIVVFWPGRSRRELEASRQPSEEYFSSLRTWWVRCRPVRRAKRFDGRDSRACRQYSARHDSWNSDRSNQKFFLTGILTGQRRHNPPR